jgi:AraC-like DNA-binding protein
MVALMNDTGKTAEMSSVIETTASFAVCVFGNLQAQEVCSRSRASMIFVHRGRVTISHEGKIEEVRKNQCFFIFDKLADCTSVELPASFSICTITDADSADFQGADRYFKLDATERIATLFRLGTDIGNPASRNSLRDAIGLALLRAFLVGRDTASTEDVPRVVSKAISYVEQHFADSCDLSLLAASAGVSKECLTSAFRRHLGITPVRYVWDLRTRKAAELVRSTRLTLASIADECGYKSPYHLSREIKRMTGLSPRALRRGSCWSR